MMNRFSSHDAGARLVRPDPPNGGAVARRAPARSARLKASAAGAAAYPTTTGAARQDRQVALGRAHAPLDRIANGARHRQAGDPHPLGPTGLPAVGDLEKWAPPLGPPCRPRAPPAVGTWPASTRGGAPR